jgi:hypothetical protein
MAREPIPEKTQTNVLLKSRRRCCLCFWLKGEDEVKKGQLAHLDGDHANPAEGNLAFMCFEHHDEYDSTTRLAKGLREAEVKRWRDELYREMDYRFRTIKRHGFELTITAFFWLNHADCFSAKFRLKNAGEMAVRCPTVAIRLPNKVGGELPDRRREMDMGFGHVASMPVLDMWAATEEQSDMFEPNGRITVKQMGGMNPVLMPGHVFDFDALVFADKEFPEGTSIQLTYRVDAEDAATVEGTLGATVPPFEEMIASALKS